MGKVASACVAKLCECLSDKDTLVRRDAANALGALGEAAEKAGRPLIELVKAEPDTVVKKTALETLTHIAGPDQGGYAKDLIPLLEDKDPEVRLSTAVVLARIGGEESATALPVLKKALKNTDPHIQELATAALATLGPLAKPAIHDLADTLTDAKNSVVVRRNAALALSHIGAEAKPIVPALVKALQRSQPLEVRQFAAEALAQMKYPANEEGVLAILEAITKDSDPLVRQKCVWALFTLSSVEKFREVGADKVLEKLLDEKGERTALLRYDAARKLANVLRDEAPDKTADALLEMLTNTQLKVYNRTDARVEGAGTESTVGRANVQPNLGGDARYMAVQALCWLGDKTTKRTDVVQALRKAAKDGDAKLKSTAKEALKDLGIKE
jgi:HEAT repeat protein